MNQNKQTSTSTHAAPATSAQTPARGTVLIKSLTAADLGQMPKWILILVAPLLVIFMVISGFVFFLPFLLPIVAWYIYVYKKQQSSAKTFAAQHGFAYQAS